MNPIHQIRGWLQARRLRSELRALNGSGGYVPAAPILSGTFVTPETALGLTAVFCAINVISRDVASLPRHVYKQLPGGGQEIDPSHRAEALIGQLDPNEDMGRFRWTQTSMGHVLGRGNGYSEIVRENGYPVGLELLHPVKTVPKRSASKKLVYELENKKILPAEDVVHFAGMGFDGISGYCPITVCRQSMGSGIATEQFGAAFFGNAAVPHGLLKHPKRLSEAAANNLRKTFNQVHQGSQSAHNFAILEEGMDWLNTQVSPEDSQFLQSRQFTVLEVARLFSVPPHKLGDYSQAHLANVEESNLDYLATTILGWVCMIDDELSRKLLTKEERKTHRIMTDLTALLRGNTAVRTTYYQTMRNMGAMSADDIRVAEGLNPLPAGKGGDLYLVQAQYQPLDQVGKAPPPAPRTSNRKAPITTGLNGHSNGDLLHSSS
jgi:HK97 family phage portal protein